MGGSSMVAASKLRAALTGAAPLVDKSELPRLAVMSPKTDFTLLSLLSTSSKLFGGFAPKPNMDSESFPSDNPREGESKALESLDLALGSVLSIFPREAKAAEDPLSALPRFELDIRLGDGLEYSNDDRVGDDVATPLFCTPTASFSFSGVVPKDARATRATPPNVVCFRSSGAEKDAKFTLAWSRVEGSSQADRVVCVDGGENSGVER
jgi:hypothetical protein